jgi:hypothetical protein
MKPYRILLTRSYLVTIKANNENEARSLVEFFTGNCKDESNSKEREKWNFSIENIELIENETDVIEEEQLKFF